MSKSIPFGNGSQRTDRAAQVWQAGSVGLPWQCCAGRGLGGGTRPNQLQASHRVRLAVRSEQVQSDR